QLVRAATSDLLQQRGGIDHAVHDRAEFFGRPVIINYYFEHWAFGVGRSAFSAFGRLIACSSPGGSTNALCGIFTSRFDLTRFFIFSDRCPLPSVLCGLETRE